MSEKYILAEHLSILNKVISETFETTNRIKFTCFDVSKHYIVFGSNSGGIYIFKRIPCQFLKLIPSKDGLAKLIAISGNEKNVAIASSRGLIIIIENCFIDSNLQYQVYSEHEGQSVTCIKWNNNDLYCGDSNGKVSVVTLLNFLTKTIFQTSVACLMHLESSIVQLDVYLKFLLVSTQTRTYLCDTEKEQYRQIGKKLRNGPFGACFFNIDKSIESNQNPSNNVRRGIFKTVDDNEQFSTYLINNNNIKIYCARPGVRLWEANFQASVIFTYQFRSSLNQNPCDLIHLDDDDNNDNSYLNISTFHHDNETEKVAENFNFEKISVICDKFLLSYKENSFYIFNPNTILLIFWCNAFNNIKDIKIIDSYLYIWQNDYQIKIVSLYTIEELVLKTLLSKQYYLSAQLCLHFSEDIINLISNSKRIHLIYVLKSKLLQLKQNDLLEKLSPIINKLESVSRERSLGKKLINGIVLVDNTQIVDNDNNIPECVRNFGNNQSTTSEGSERRDEKTNANKDFSDADVNVRLNILYKQYQFNKIHENLETTDTINLLNSLSVNEIYELLLNFVEFVYKLETVDCKFWCQKLFLRRLSQLNVKLLDEEKLLNFSIDAFLAINESKQFGCNNCGFPLPKASKTKPKYYDLGCELMDQSNDVGKFTLNVPYMHKYSCLNKLNEFPEIQSNLPIIIQYSDIGLIKNLLSKFTYDLWDESLRYLIKLKQGICLNCSNSISVEGVIDWKTYSLLIVQSIKATNAIKLLKRYSNFIPNGALDKAFYQYCIFSTTIKEETSIDKEESCSGLNNQLTSSQLENLVVKCLQKNHNNLSTVASFPVCSYCNLSLQYPTSDKESQLNSCGHNYHSLCYKYNNNKCYICNSCV